MEAIKRCREIEEKKIANSWSFTFHFRIGQS